MSHNPKFEASIRGEWPEVADTLLGIIRGTREHVLTFEAARRRDRESYHPHELNTLRLEALDEVLQGCGVEYINFGRGSKSPSIEYVNFGDTYDTTICLLTFDSSANREYRQGWDCRQVWRVTSWGDIVEAGDYD